MSPTAARLIRFASLTAEPWRNKGGTTVEIDRGAAAAGADWGWRISAATVDRAGEFSAFAGCERILTVVDGEFMLLTVDGVEHGLQRFRPFRFDGGAATSAALPQGPIRDLNLITGPDYRGHVVIVELSKKRPHPVFGDQHAVLLQGSATVTGVGPAEGPDAAPVALENLDTVVGADDETPQVCGRGFLAVISVETA